MKQLFIFTSLLSLILVLYSCENEIQSDTLHPSPTVVAMDLLGSTIEVENGIVRIPDMETALYLEKGFLSERAQEYEAAASKIPSFRSAEEAYLSATSESFQERDYLTDSEKRYARVQEGQDGKSIERIIDNPMMSFLSNDQGWIQIGDHYYLSTYTSRYVVDENNHQMYQAGSPISELSILEETELVRNNKVLLEKRVMEERTTFYGTRRKIVLEDVQNSGLLGNITNSLRARHLRKNKFTGIWFGERADQLTIVWDVVYASLVTLPGELMPSSGSVIDNGVQQRSVSMPSGQQVFLNSRALSTATAIDGGALGTVSLPTIP